MKKIIQMLERRLEFLAVQDNAEALKEIEVITSILWKLTLVRYIGPLSDLIESLKPQLSTAGPLLKEMIIKVAHENRNDKHVVEELPKAAIRWLRADSLVSAEAGAEALGQAMEKQFRFEAAKKAQEEEERKLRELKETLV